MPDRAACAAPGIRRSTARTNRAAAGTPGDTAAAIPNADEGAGRRSAVPRRPPPAATQNLTYPAPWPAAGAFVITYSITWPRRAALLLMARRARTRRARRPAAR